MGCNNQEEYDAVNDPRAAKLRFLNNRPSKRKEKLLQLILNLITIYHLKDYNIMDADQQKRLDKKNDPDNRPWTMLSRSNIFVGALIRDSDNYEMTVLDLPNDAGFFAAGCSEHGVQELDITKGFDIKIKKEKSN